MKTLLQEIIEFPLEWTARRVSAMSGFLQHSPKVLEHKGPARPSDKDEKVIKYADLPGRFPPVAIPLVVDDRWDLDGTA